MRPVVDFRIVEWATATEVLKVHIFGFDDNGNPIDKKVVFHEPVTIDEVHKVVAKVNNGVTRRVP